MPERRPQPHAAPNPMLPRRSSEPPPAPPTPAPPTPPLPAGGIERLWETEGYDSQRSNVSCPLRAAARRVTRSATPPRRACLRPTPDTCACAPQALPPSCFRLALSAVTEPPDAPPPPPPSTHAQVRRMLGYFSLLGLLRVYAILGNHTQALQARPGGGWVGGGGGSRPCAQAGGLVSRGRGVGSWQLDTPE